MQLHISLHAQEVEKSSFLTENKMRSPDPGREKHITLKKNSHNFKESTQACNFSPEQKYITL